MADKSLFDLYRDYRQREVSTRIDREHGQYTEPDLGDVVAAVLTVGDRLAAELKAISFALNTDRR